VGRTYEISGTQACHARTGLSNAGLSRFALSMPSDVHSPGRPICVHLWSFAFRYVFANFRTKSRTARSTLSPIFRLNATGSN